MKNQIKTPHLLIILAIFIFSCQKENTSERNEIFDPLPSWEDGKAKSDIINFVTEAIDPNNINFIPVKERIATFDNDGTLWTEQPLYFQLFFTIDRIKELAKDNPEWKNEEPYKTILENDHEKLTKLSKKELLQLVMTTHANVTTKEFNKIIRDWLENSLHPKFQKPYNQLVYQPMLELLDYLRDNEFQTFIVSGGGIDFIRVWGEDTYDIPKHQIIGSSIKSEFFYDKGKAYIQKIPEIDFIDDHEGKPLAIHKHIGRKPVIAVGNSDGDLEMLQWAASNSNPHLAIYLHHTDKEREYAYDRNSPIGRLDKGLDEALKRNWTVIDMQKDWNTIYPFELDKK
ncbi:HAD family hydrolase [Sediminitomix flava]|uniref:phosphoserine phosphatase n=1 Tax=Sediminitomix flava TaxID=379075 RepID=A0A315ZC06_SEDFL|nr:HAD family hydrolase [Sediminitomix flava]PWJ42623.1 haloacid dehalogenase-like hydrolase [Sediminitomix flava]